MERKTTIITALSLMSYLLLFNCDNHSIEPVDGEPTLNISPSEIDYGSSDTTKKFNITNGDVGSLTWNICDDKTWITVNPTSGSTTTEIDQITVNVDRSGLNPGIYTGIISIISNHGKASVTVRMTVPEDPGPLRIYMKSYGNDLGTGLDLNQAVQTLNRVQEILEEIDPDTDIEVHINQGTYLKQEIVWTYSNGNKTTFTAIEFSKDRPVFDGVGRDTWFKLNEERGMNTNLYFRFIKVKNYNLAVWLNGNKCDPDNGWNGNNHFYGMYFENIGSQFTISDKLGVAAIELLNSRNNSIINCHFVNIEDLDDEDAHMHACYLAHYSSNNEILRNRFENVYGNPIRIRNNSNYNSIEGNNFIRTGLEAFYDDWFCINNCRMREDCPLFPKECPSYGNEFRNNDCNKNYFGLTPNLIRVRPPDDYCGILPDGRVDTSGNTNH